MHIVCVATTSTIGLAVSFHSECMFMMCCNRHLDKPIYHADWMCVASHVLDHVFAILANWSNSLCWVRPASCHLCWRYSRTWLGDDHFAGGRQEQGEFTAFSKWAVCHIQMTVLKVALSLPFPELRPLPKGDPVPLPLLAKRGPSSNWLHAEDDGASGEEAEGAQGTSDGHVRVRLLLSLKSVKIATNVCE